MAVWLAVAGTTVDDGRVVYDVAGLGVDWMLVKNLAWRPWEF